ncbi:MAG TPA: Hsp20/alpha crystallin family protein [Pyrinomonadaceae bacterium]|nr:Hsp20/alpha crystallin family protein [Pyrinomonadaceae bacterium]
MKVVSVTGLERLELERLRDRVGRLLAALEEATLTDAPAEPGAWSPPVDVCEAEDAVTVRVELPGMIASQLKVGLTSAQLRICGEKKRNVPRGRAIAHLCSERSYGRFSRTLPLRWTINVAEATAELKNGLLVVRLPKRKDRRGAEFKVPIKEVISDEG